MPFLLMVFLTVVCLPEVTEWPRPLWTESPAWSIAVTGLGVVLLGLNGWRLSRALVRGLGGDPARREAVLRRYERGRTRHLLLMIAVYVLSLVGLGWGWAVGQVWSRPGEAVWVASEGVWEVSPIPLPGAEVLMLAPFLLAQLLSWALFYDADRAACQPAAGSAGREAERLASFGSRVSYVIFHARQKLALVFLPVVLLLAHKELRRLFPDDGREWDAAVNVAGPVALGVVFVTLPWTVRLLLGLRPMPDGPLRTRLQAASRRLGFRCSNLLVWNTRSGMANAMVIGLLPWIRYVVFTDRLLEDFSPDEIEAVFGHEVGHVKHQHMLYYLGFLLGSVFILGTLVQMAANGLSTWFSAEGKTQDWVAILAGKLHLGEHGYLAFVPLVFLLLSYIFVVFGFLSRRCERQADVFGCRAVSCARADCAGHDDGSSLADGVALCPTGIRIFIRALEKVAQVNGISRDRPGFLQSWQHSTIARRVEFLQRILADPAEETLFQQRVAGVKLALEVCLEVGLVLVSIAG
jgi:STE24 endopeptidase